VNHRIPIPEIGGDPDVSQVRVCESGEGLSMVTTGGRIWVAPAYAQLGFTTAMNTIWLRTGTFEALQRAAASLPAGMSILVWDGVRSLETQREIAERFLCSLSHLRIDLRERETIVRQYVSPLPASEVEYHGQPPPHATGGGVDVSLADERGRPLDLGAGFDQFDLTAWLTYYERVCRKGGASQADRDRCLLRRVLYWAMTAVGFAPYVWEFWHFEYRTRRAAAFYNEPTANYGPAVPWERNGGI
jgi:D-alanyl-D-alanine dipeptidase